MILWISWTAKYHADVIVSHRRDTLIFLVNTIFKITFCWGNGCICKVLKRAPLADTFYCAKNMHEMKYHVGVSHRRDSINK